MKNYTITVNGTVYDVTVEEGIGTGAPAAPAPQGSTQSSSQGTGSTGSQGGRRRGCKKVTASVPGKVFKVEANAGQAVKAGDTIIVLEAMKMEIPVVAPQDGTVASVDVAVGDAVESGDTLATMN